MLLTKESIIREYKCLLVQELEANKDQSLFKAYMYFLHHAEKERYANRMYNKVFYWEFIKVHFIRQKHLIRWRTLLYNFQPFEHACTFVDRYEEDLEKSVNFFKEYLDQNFNLSQTWYIYEAQEDAYIKLLGVMKIVFINYLTMLIKLKKY